MIGDRRLPSLSLAARARGVYSPVGRPWSTDSQLSAWPAPRKASGRSAGFDAEGVGERGGRDRGRTDCEQGHDIRVLEADFTEIAPVGSIDPLRVSRNGGSGVDHGAFTGAEGGQFSVPDCGDFNWVTAGGFDERFAMLAVQ